MSSSRGSKVLLATAASCLLAGTIAWAAVGGIAQLSGSAGCVSLTGSDGLCVDGTALNGVNQVVVSGDGRFVYATGGVSDSVLIFSRDARTGAITQLPGNGGCVSETGTEGECADGKALDGPVWLEIAPDGEHVYVASLQSDAIAVFQRDSATGKLSQLAGLNGCVSETGSGGTCADGTALDGTRGLDISSDGGHLYAASIFSDSVTSFTVDPADGFLTQLAGGDACTNESGGGGCTDGRALDTAVGVSVSPDNTSVYVTSAGANEGVAVFGRNTTTGVLSQPALAAGCITETGADNCADGRALDLPIVSVMDGGGAHLYVASEFSNGISVLDRDPADSSLSQDPGVDGCITATGAPDCRSGEGLTDVVGVTMGPGSARVYTAALAGDSVAVLERDPSTGGLSQPPVDGACVSETGGGICSDGFALDNVFRTAVSPDGRHLYAAANASDAITAFSIEQPANPAPDPAPDPAPNPAPNPNPVDPDTSDCDAATAALAKAKAKLKKAKKRLKKAKVKLKDLEKRGEDTADAARKVKKLKAKVKKAKKRRRAARLGFDAAC